MIVLVNDGEVLVGVPVHVAESCAGEGTRIDVVQIGGRAPEVIPEVTADGHVTGFRKDDQGKPLTTELSAEGGGPSSAKIARLLPAGRSSAPRRARPGSTSSPARSRR